MKKTRISALFLAIVLGISSFFSLPALANDGNYNYYYSYNNASLDTYTVQVTKGYLALRTEKAYNTGNEIGQLHTGDYVQVVDRSDSTYWYVYACSLGYYGYVNKDYLVYAGYSSLVTGDLQTVSVASGYLALRTAMAYDSANEIGKLYTGQVVKVLERTSSTYWYVYSPDYDTEGYVNCKYLISGYAGSVYPAMAVSVSKGYLALRTYKAYDSINEIGQLYTGDLVQVIDTSDSKYWYVYSHTLGLYGFVNKNYLVGYAYYPTTETRTVSVSKNYLALRSAMAYDSSNEIGRLYSGDVVQVTSHGNNRYWYVFAPSLGKCGYVDKDYLF